MDGAPAPSPPPLWQSLLLPVLLLVAGVGGLLVLKSRARPPAEVEVRRAPLRVPVLALERSEVVVTLTGHAALRPRRAGPVASELRARVRKVAEDLRPGAMVREGQVLVELDGDDSESALASARAELTAGKAGLERLEIERGRNESLVKVRREVFDLAEREWQRGQELRRGGSLISDSELGRLKLEALRAREGVLQLERALELHAPLCREQQARVEIFEQQVRRLERDLERTRIAAPFAGRIERAAAEVGRLALPGEPLFELADDSRLEAPVPLLAEEAERWLEADTSTGWYVLKRPHVARLKWVSGSLTAQGRLLRLHPLPGPDRRVEAVVEVDGGSELKAGMFVAAEIEGKKLSDVFVVPARLVSVEGEMALARPDGGGYELELRRPAWLRRTAAFAIAREGLEPGELAVQSPLAPVPGLKLEPVAPQAETTPAR